MTVKVIDRPAALIVKVVLGTAIGRRYNDSIGEPEILLRWSGAQGEPHEQWFPLSQIKFED
jgi:hypothetical protein